jgi:hypothetical protein
MIGNSIVVFIRVRSGVTLRVCKLSVVLDQLRTSNSVLAGKHLSTISPSERPVKILFPSAKRLARKYFLVATNVSPLVISATVRHAKSLSQQNVAVVKVHSKFSVSKQSKKNSSAKKYAHR